MLDRDHRFEASPIVATQKGRQEAVTQPACGGTIVEMFVIRSEMSAQDRVTNFTLDLG
jgi:hypothetical protein